MATHVTTVVKNVKYFDNKPNCNLRTLGGPDMRDALAYSFVQNPLLLLDFLSTVLTRDVVSCISIGIDEIEYEIAEYDDEFAVEYEIVEDDDKLAAEDEDEINDDDEIVT
ncbi:unnamed protein product, partial [Rotaria socialis]